MSDESVDNKGGSLLPDWNSLEGLERYQDALGSIGFWGPIAIATLGLILGTAWGVYNRKVESRVKELQSLAEKGHAAKIDADILAAKQSSAARADLLSLDARKRIAFELSGLSNGSVGILRLDPDAETNEFADVLAEILTQAGCRGAQSTVKVEYMRRGDPGRVILTALEDTEESRNSAKLIATTLKDAGVPDVVVGNGPPPIRVGRVVQITVKVK